MDFDEIEQLRSRHAAWSLLTSRNAALVLSFLGRVFVDANEGNIPAERLTSLLDDELFALNQRLTSQEADPAEAGHGADSHNLDADRAEPSTGAPKVAARFPRSAKQYLDEWAAPERGWLRRFYPPSTDEPHYDLTPAVEKALAWVEDLRARTFVGTESRLSTIFELLRQLVYGAEEDPQVRLDDLHRRRAALDSEIARIESGEIALADPVTQRDRYQQFGRTARELLADFRQVEANFRTLDQGLREQIALWEGSKGELLDDLFTNRSGITESDQGRSFRAFYDLLLSSEQQAELAALLTSVHNNDSIVDLDPRLARVQYDWVDASERTQATVRRLSEQLRRFLDDQVWIDNRRVFDLIHSIEVRALRVRDDLNSSGESVSAAVLTPAMELEDTSVKVTLPMERPLYRRTRTSGLEAVTLEIGSGAPDADVLFEQAYVDRDALVRAVMNGLGSRGSVRLDDVVNSNPLRLGLAELVGYLSLDESGLRVEFDEGERTSVSWVVEDAVDGLDAAGLDAAGLDAAGLDAAGLDAAGLDAAGLDAAGLDAPASDEVVGQQTARATVQRVADIPVVVFRRVDPNP